MESEKRIFTLRYKSAHSKKYKTLQVEGNENTTLDIVWMSQKCWFGPGTRVTISDAFGNAKSYMKK